MSRSRVLIQGALACALILAGITTVFVRSGDDDVATPLITPPPTTAVSPTPSLDTTPSAKPSPPAKPTVKPSTPLTRQEASPVGVFEIWQPKQRAPEIEQAEPQPVTCAILSHVRETIEGKPISPHQAKAMNLTCIKSASVVRVYRDAPLAMPAI